MRVADRRRFGERGAGLLELAAAMPLLALLLAAVGTSFAFGVRAYAFLLSDWEMQREAGFAMERMTADLRYAEDAEVLNGRLRVRCRQTSEAAQWVEYARTSGEMPRMTRNSQPMTGESTLGPIAMTRFEAERVGARTMRLRLDAENRLTGRAFSLETAVTWPERGA